MSQSFPVLSTLHPARTREFQSTINALCGGVALICCVVLVGWVIDSKPMKSVVPGMITMKVNTGVGLLLLTTSLFGIGRHEKIWRVLVPTSLAVLILLVLATLSEYAFGVDLRIDNLLVRDWESARFPGRNAPATNIAFLGIAAAMMMLHRSRSVNVAQALLLIVSAAPLATLGGYLYRAPGMYQNAPYPVIALNTSIALMLLCFGGLLARADHGFMRIIVSHSVAGSLGRRLLPIAAGLPLLIGLIVLAGEEAGLYTSAFASALMVVGCAVLFASTVLVTIVQLWKAEVVTASSQLEQVRLLDAERSARADAERANRLKDEFLSLVSHELRTPLTAMLGWSQLLQLRRSPDEIDEGLAIIVDNAHAQRQIIDDLLDMGRIISGKLKLQLKAVDLTALLQLSVQSLKPTADAKSVSVRLDCPHGVWSLLADPARLQQIFWNLLSNAVKFTNRGGTVQVLAEFENGFAVVRFSDTGSGIAAAFLPYVFDRFRQADSSTSRLHGGLGLGLSIVKQLTELHGGSVEASSKGVGHGSTFTIRLPATAPLLNSATIGSAGPTQFASTIPAIPVHDVTGLKVLAIDDEPDSRALIKRRLEDWGAVCETVGSGDEAIDLMRETRFDVLISDIGMPGEDGYALIKRIRALSNDAGGDIPAIALTAYTRPEDRRKALEAGFQMHLGKPIEQAALLAGLARLAATLDELPARTNPRASIDR